MIFSRLIFIIIVMMLSGCSTAVRHISDQSETEKETEKGRILLKVIDSGIDGPSEDRRVFYRIYMNKLETGRTTTGLESQYKTYETSVSPNRHLIMLEKWALNAEQGEYVKLNNINQLKPSYCYIVVESGKTTEVVVTGKKDGAAEYSIKVY